MFLLAALLAACLPAIAFTLAPLFLGPLHVVVGGVVLARTQRDPRAFRLGFVIAAALFVVLELVVAPHIGRAAVARAELVIGVAWALASVAPLLASGRAPRDALVLCALAWTTYAALSVAMPIAFLALVIAGHNVVSIAVALRVRGRSLQPVAVGLVVCLAFATFTHASGWEPIASALGVADRRLALAFLYLQLAHYAVWLAALPSLRRDGRPSALALLALAASFALLAVAPHLGGLARVRATYLSVAAFHVLAELVAITSRLLRPSFSALSKEARSS